jgi:hypothetical protein
MEVLRMSETDGGDLTRREALGLAAVCLGAPGPGAEAEPAFQISVFWEEITTPLGHPLMGGGVAPARSIEDPLYAHGFALHGAGKPMALVALDWCEVRNDAYERWRGALAEALDTDPVRVLVCCLHQHDAPVADLVAQRLLEEHRAKGTVCDLDFHEKAVRRVARAAREAAKKRRAVTHVGIGQAKVDRIASNRRYLDDSGKVRYDRMSATRDAKVRAADEGTIDPWLKTLSFWDGEKPLLAVSAYATHPMSSYGRGGVSADFVGLARKRRQVDDPAVSQMYVSGCSGNVTAGKYNDGSPGNRPVLAERLYVAMKEAWKVTKRHPLETIDFRSAALELEARGGAGFTEKDLTKRLKDDPKPFGQCLAALGLSWRKRVDAGKAIDVAAIDFGPAVLSLLPAEAYVEYQLLAQEARPDAFVVTAGYGECGPGYIPVERAWAERDGNLNDWCWVAPGSEKKMARAIAAALRAKR